MNRGQSIITVIMWAGGLAVTAMLASVGYSNAAISKVEDKQIEVVQRMSVVETKSDQYEKDIQQINKKLDLLIQKIK